VQGGQRGQAVADDGDGDARLDTRLHRPGGYDHLVDIVPSFDAYVALEPFEHLARQEAREVEAVDPLHLHHANAAAIHPVVDVEQIVLLDLGDAGGHLRHPAHRLVVRTLVLVAFRREYLQRHRQREVVGPAPLRQIDHPLPPGTK